MSPADKAVAGAWKRYLSATRNLIGYRYEDVEPFAWRRLESDLARIEMVGAPNKRKKKLVTA